MFFSDITNYSNKKLSALYWVFLIVYFIVMLLGPFIIISERYEIFKEVGTKQLTGFGVCILLAFMVIGLRFLKSKIALLPENTVNQRRFKFTIQMIYSLIFPVACVFVLCALWSNFDLAFATIRDCLIFIISGILLDYLVIKYLESERTLRSETQRDNEKAKRMHLFK